MKIEQLKPGMTVYDVHSHKMGNTTMRTMGTWQVRIISVDLDKGYVEASWNGNPSTKYYGRSFKWREHKPVMITYALGRRRLATHAELKAMKEAKA